MSETWVKRAISKSKPLFVIILVESNTSEKVKPLHHLAQSLLKDFEDVFLNDVSTRLPQLRGIEHQINVLLGAPFAKQIGL